MSKKIENQYRLDPWPSQGKVDAIPIPSKEVLDYILENDALKFKGLALHMVTTLVVADKLIGAIEKANENESRAEQFDIKPQVTLETMIAYHATRPLAEAGSAGEAPEAINKYMETHDDIDLAVFIGTQEHLPLSVVMAMEELQKSRGAPLKTMGPENPFHPQNIDWTVALTQISSWLVAGGIIPMEKRFEDLITRHASAPDSPKKFTKGELLALKDWGLARLNEICVHVGIPRENFMDWLKEQVQPNMDTVAAKKRSDELIRELFSRGPKDDEFLPTVPSYVYLAKGLMAMEASEVGEIDGKNVVVKGKKRRWIETMIKNPKRFLELCVIYGLLDKRDGEFVSKT